MLFRSAREKTPQVIGVFCFDPAILESDDIASARVAYLIGCLAELQRSYREVGGQLLILQGQPSQAIPRLAEALQATAIYWNLDVEPYAKLRDKNVREALQEKGITVQTFWDQLLHAPGEVLSQSKNYYTVYTPFWKNWSQQTKILPAQNLSNVKSLTAEEIVIAQQAGAIDLPTVEDLGFSWNKPLLLDPGETAARERLEVFCSTAINEYQEQRHYPGIDGTSLLSAALKFGAIGIRTVWQASLVSAENSYSDEVSKSIQTWQKELAWREFYQHCLYFIPELANGAYRQQFKNFP